MTGLLHTLAPARGSHPVFGPMRASPAGVSSSCPPLCGWASTDAAAGGLIAPVLPGRNPAVPQLTAPAAQALERVEPRAGVVRGQ